MFMDLSEICPKYEMRDFNVLHIGAHKAEEREGYKNNGAKEIVWIEANPDLADSLRDMISEGRQDFEMEEVINAAILDVDDKKIEFKITNNGQSSSLLEFGTHSDSYPTIVVDKVIEVHTKRIDTLAGQTPELFANLNFANLDIQGVELEALKSFGSLLDQFNWVYSEVNREEVYKNNGMIWEVDKFLLQHGFYRKETVFTEAGWGDALYVRQKSSSSFSIGAYKIQRRFEYFTWWYSKTYMAKKSRKVLRKIKRLKNRFAGSTD